MSLVMKLVNADIFPAADIFPYFHLPPWWKQVTTRNTPLLSQATGHVTGYTRTM